MALIDALLLDPYPLAVWLAVRTDGQKGSGSTSDPYDESTATANMLGQTAAGFQADGVEYGLIEQNIIDAESPNPIHRFTVKRVKCFNNRSAAGRLLRSADYSSGSASAPDSELEDLIESATLLSI